MQISTIIIVEAPDKLGLYSLESAKISAKSVVQAKGFDSSSESPRIEDAVSCTCTAFTVCGHCIHSRNTEEIFTHGWKNILGVGESSIPLGAGQVGILGAGKTVKSFLIPPVAPEVSAFDVIKAIRGDTFDDSMISTSGSYDILRGQIESAFSKGLTLSAPEILDHKPENTTPAVEVVAEAKERPAWAKVEKPEGFWVTDDVWESLLWAASHGANALLTGPTGSGKTEVIYKVASALGLGMEPFNFGATSEARSFLIGNTHLNKEDGTFFTPSRFVRSIQKEDGVVLLDEVTRAEYTALNIIFPLMDSQKFVSLDESEDTAVIYRGKNVAFLATANVGFEYTGTEALDRALKDRFNMKIHLDYPPQEEEAKVVAFRYPEVDCRLIEKVVAAAHKQRDMAKQGLFEDSISTRMILDCFMSINDGLSVPFAVRHAILGCFTQSGGGESDQMKVAQIFTKHDPRLVGEK